MHPIWNMGAAKHRNLDPPQPCLSAWLLTSGNCMSYDISLCDPVTGDTLQLDEPHHMRGGTFCIGGTTDAHLNVTYNYAQHYYRLFPKRPARDNENDRYNVDLNGEVGGIRSLYGLTGAESIPVLEQVIAQLGDDTDPNYWAATEGNAKRALTQLLALAQMRPDGVWNGD